jgi:DNA modification methylase
MSFPEGTTEHPINKSKKRKILVSLWDFGAVHPQTERSHYLCNDHPAKMRPCLARAILQIYGESPVLDPMAGIGTTLVEAMLLGMDAVGVEYEKKFVDQANRNIEHLKKLFPNKKLGNAICIEGDARNLSCLNSQKVRSVIFSPPYFNAIESVSTGHQGPEGGHLERQHKLAKLGRSGYGKKSNIGHVENYGSIVFSPPYFNAIKKGDEGPHARSKKISYEERVNRFQGYSTDKENIGNISKFGSIIFSPPYFDALSITKGGGSKTSIQHEESTQELQMKRSGTFAVEKNLPTPYSSKEGNIGNLSEFGSIIFSPPYFCSISDIVKSRHKYPKTKKGMSRRQEYSSDPNNIGNIPQFGSILFSPPLEEINKGSGIAKKGYKGKYGKDVKLKDRCDRPLSGDRQNISDVYYGRTYLGEMFKVYLECFRVLKPGKFMVVVVKDIQRSWKTIPLGADTIKLCQLVGFELHDIIINKMYFPSFWILDLAKKSQKEENRGTEKFHILKNHEYVLVFRKPK